MKFLKKISIFLFAAAIFMSALVVFAEESNDETPNWPYLEISVSVSSKNKITDTDEASFKQKITSSASIPFFALARDYPDLTMWANRFEFTTAYRITTYGTSKKYELTKVDYTLHGYSNYTDPYGMLAQINKVVDGFIPTGETMYDNLLSIHNFICKINTYVRESEGALYCYSAYGSLVNRRSVCEGYAEAFKLLCDKVGIDCILVTGMSKPASDKPMEAHMWNLVRMDDDVWYAVDVTWDDAGDVDGNLNYFLVGADTVIRGKKFSESHITSYDFVKIEGSGKTIPDLEYPTLSSVAYDKENGRTDYSYSGGRFHYSFLSDIEKEIYDAMLEKLLSDMPSDPTKTPLPEPTDDLVTTTPDQTTPPPVVTTPEITTTEDETTVNITTTEKETTEEITTTEKETMEEITTTEKETTEEITTTKPAVTTPEQTTESETVTETTEPTVTTTEPVTTPSTTKPVTTTPNSTAPPPESSSSEKETESDSEPDTSKTDTTKPDTSDSDTTTKPDTSDGDTTTKPDTSVGTTTSGNNSNKDNSDISDLYKTLTVVLIASAITCLSVILGIIIIRYAKKHNG